MERGKELFNRYRGYTRYAGDGHHRIWFITTDGHPSLLDGVSLYAGYLENGRVHRSDGTDVGAMGASLDPGLLTVVARGVRGDVDHQIGYWGADIELEPGTGNPVITFSDRHPGRSPVTGRTYNHDYFYGRWTGSRWDVSRLSAGGSELYSRPESSQPDYTGLSAIDPGDPNHVYVSTDVDPRTGTPLVSTADGRAHWEISEGRTVDGGHTWSWAGVTSNSTTDNLRPTVPRPRDGNQALLWLQGSYPDFLFYDLDVVGIIQRSVAPPPAAPPLQPAGAGYHVAGQDLAIGDLDGNGRADLVFSGPPGVEHGESLSLPGGRRRSVYRLPPTSVASKTLVGDFDGDGRADTFAYTPGPAPDPVRLHDAAGQYTTVSLAVNGASYRPVVADVDGDHRDDIVWYGPGAVPDSLWRATGGGRFRSEPLTIKGDYRPVPGDFNGDGLDDIIWYAPGTAADSLWQATGNGRFRSEPLTINGPYQPVAGDFDGDGRDDVLWYRAGSGPDSVWFSGPGGGFRSVSTTVNGTYRVAAGDLDHDGRDDVVWYDPIRPIVLFWYGGAAFPGH